MQTKKDPKVNLEPRKVTYVLIGLVTTLALLFVALEWSDTSVRRTKVFTRAFDMEDPELPIVTIQQNVTPPPPPPLPDVIERFDVVEDEVNIEDYDLVSMEDDDDVPIQIISLEGAPSEGEEPEDGDQPFVMVEEQPQFPGGESALMAFIKKTLRYPAFAAENGIQGRVTLSFVVERDGSIAQIEVMRSPAEELSKESIRVVQTMPKWKPGKQRGKAVRVKYVLPITFRLS